MVGGRGIKIEEVLKVLKKSIDSEDFYNRIKDAVYISCPFYDSNENCCLSRKNPRFDESTKSSKHIVFYLCKGTKEFSECPFC